MVKTEIINQELLDEKIKESGLKLTYIAEVLGITIRALKLKRQGKAPFRAAEIYVLCDLLHLNIEDKQKIFA